MKRLLTTAALAAIGAFGLAGCNSGSSGGPGATGTGSDGKTHVGTAEQTFTLSVPTLSTHIKQGESKVVAIGIKRGKNFDQDVTLKLDGLPKGVTADMTSHSIKHGEDEAKVTLKAADDAALGDFTVKVNGHPATGADATNEFKLTVEKK